MARRIDQRCSFCGKKKDQVRKLVAGPGVFICDQCIELCVEVLKEEPPAPRPDEPGGWRSETCRGRRSGWFWRLFRAQVRQPV